MALTVLAGCGLVTPVATQVPYSPGDGVQASVGDVEIINAVLVAESGGSDGNLLFSAHNGTSQELRLTVQYEADGAEVTLQPTIAPRAVTSFGFGEGGQLLLPNVNAEPGDLFHVFFQYGDEEGVLLTVPVLDGTLPYYTELLPQAPAVDEAESADADAAE